VPKIIKFGGDLTKLWQKQVGSFFGTPCISLSLKRARIALAAHGRQRRRRRHGNIAWH